MLRNGADDARARIALVRAIKAWTAAHAQLADDDTVLVIELACREPGCPPLETVIAVSRSGARPDRRSIHKPLAEVVEADVRALFEKKERPDG
ncbi:MAG: nitrate reductase [Deltaproteobacteria bacterium]|nr:nitrate reductase [Deltaproteobacteria bacterium]